ncbi:unnamed protein product [Rotaria socialis]|uniref:Uncharacterized protein n=1 Tax=Rotaria socialis TaxID=392032 RepID=A0A817YAU9_9BILA|nr:unnamed protein product [Rotaria socialis]CAF4715822.1 unnamed protein product [Rotaria socialis]
MPFRSRCKPNDVPFFRVIVAFRSMLTINRYCHSQKIFDLLRSNFCLLKSFLPIILHEVTTDKEFILTNDISTSKTVDSGVYLAFLKYDDAKYQPLMDLKLVPIEIFPEKTFLPKSIPFIIFEIEPFVKALNNMIDYMKEYEKTKLMCQKHTNMKNDSHNHSPLNSISQLSTSKRSYHTRNTNIQRSSSIISPDLISTPLSTIVPVYVNNDVDIRKYTVTDSERINSLSFTFRVLNRKEQMIYQKAISNQILFPPIKNLYVNKLSEFNENEIVLFKQRLLSLNVDSSLKLELKNCIHQLAIENKLDKTEVCDLLMKLDHQVINNQLHNNDIIKIIKELQEIASSHRQKTSLNKISNVMKVLFRIDYLEKFNKLDKQKINLFNQRINHLARMGILNQQSRMFKKLFQLDLFQHEPSQQAFSQFIDEDLQHIIPKPIPLNNLGRIKEIIHQLQLNIDHLGPITTCILIDNVQQLVQSGLLLTLYKVPQVKRCLIQFVEYIQTGRFVGIHLQRLIEQINPMKKVSFTNQLNILLQNTKRTTSTYSSNELISLLMNLACKGQLNTYDHVLTKKHLSTTIFEQIDLDDNSLQSIINFLYEQSSLASPMGHIPFEYVNNFIQYLRHFAQLGILYEPQVYNILTDLHKSKDQNHITLETFKTMLEHIKNVHYVYAYNHLNLMEFDNFLNDMISNGHLTCGQAWLILDHLMNLCRIEPITNYDIKTILINIQLEYNRQQSTYLKLIDCLQSLAASYSNSLAEIHSLERELQSLLVSSHSAIKRIPDEIRKRLNDLILFCKKLSNDPKLLEQLFGQTMNYKFYNKMKEILETKNFLSRKQSLTAIVQMHKHFLKISNLNLNNILSAHELDKIFEHKCFQQDKHVQESIKHMAELGYLQDKSFVNYLLNEYFLSNEFSSCSIEKCHEIQMKLQSWPLTLDYNHSHVRLVIEHLIQLEQQDKIDTGTLIEIQNRLNRLARVGKSSLPQIKFIIDEIHKSQGKTNLFDKNGFQSIQSYRLILHDITCAIELEFYIQQLTSEYKLPDNFNYRFRHFLYQILQNELFTSELIPYRFQLEKFHHLQQIDIDQIKKFIDLLPKEVYGIYPLTLTDKLLERLKWDGKTVDKSMRDPLLKLERCGALSQDNFEDIYNSLYRTADVSQLSFQQTNKNQLLIDLFDKINDLLHDNIIDLQKSIEIKEQVYFLEEVIDLTDLSQIITFQSRLLNSSNQNDFLKICEELKTFVYQEQFRLSKAQDFISLWHLNDEKGNSNEKQIMKLFNDLAHLHRLYNNSSTLILNRYMEMKQINQVAYRHLIKDLQRLLDHAFIEKQIIECIRSIEAQVYKVDYRRRFDEVLIKKIEAHLKHIFISLPHSFEYHWRFDICKKLHEFVDAYINSNGNENSFDEFLNTFDVYISQIKYRPSRSSKTRHHYVSSDATVPRISSLQSL